MVRTLNEKIASLPAVRREKIEARAAVLIAEEMSLRELRKALGKTQAKLAADLGVGQDSVARYEHRTDMLISTLREFIQKVGGTLELIARFPNRDPVRIGGFGDLAKSTQLSRNLESPKRTRSSSKAGAIREKRKDASIGLRKGYGTALVGLRPDAKFGAVGEPEAVYASKRVKRSGNQ